MKKMRSFALPAFFSGILILALSCNNQKQHQHGRNNAAGTANEEVQSQTVDADNPAYYLKLSLAKGSTYHYTVEYETETDLEVTGKKINILNQSEVDISYGIDKDSAGNFIFQVRYDRIHIRTKTGDKSTEYNVPYTEETADPMQRMLGILKTANIIATVTPAGKVTGVTGYQGLSEKITADLNVDVSSRQAAQAQLDKIIGEGILKKNLDQLFNLFPDSAIHIGDSWKTNATQKGDIKGLPIVVAF